MLRGGQLASALVAASLWGTTKPRCGRSSARPLAWSRPVDARDRAPLYSCSRTRRRAVQTLLCFELSETRREGGGAAGGRPVAAARVTLAQVRGARTACAAVAVPCVVDAAGDAADADGAGRCSGHDGTTGGVAPDHAPRRAPKLSRTPGVGCGEGLGRSPGTRGENAC